MKILNQQADQRPVARSRLATACLLALVWAAGPGPATASGATEPPASRSPAAEPRAAGSSARVQRSGPEGVARARAAVLDLLVLRCEKAADCATVGLGERSCGGPEQFIAYAPTLTPQPALQEALQEYAKLRRQQQEARGEMSTCEMLPDPGAFCSPAGLCTVQSTRRGVPGSVVR